MSGPPPVDAALENVRPESARQEAARRDVAARPEAGRRDAVRPEVVRSEVGRPDSVRPDVVCLGESMVTFLPSRPGRLADVPSFTRAIGGAESNVACALAAAGHRVRWVGRVGRDGFGDHLVDTIAGYGVDVSAVGRDPHRPTGVYFRTDEDRATDAHEVVYYRAGSAASAMSPATVPYEAVADARILHLTGITAALSADCLALMRELTAPRPGRPLVSFDVNHRPGLWRDGRASEVLLELARRADVVFVGADEAAALWDCGDPAAIRAVLAEPGVVVVKLGGEGAMAFERCAASFPTRPLPEPGLRPGPGASNAGGAEYQPVRRSRTRPQAVRGSGGLPPVSGRGRVGEKAPRSGPAAALDTAPLDAPAPVGRPPRGRDTATPVPAPRVTVVSPVGAGDAFAAGFLSGTLRGLDMRTRLRHGHLAAAAALTVPGDLARPARRARADRLAALDDAAWGTLHLGPGWTGDDQEVRTP
ncbi:PfkB family carbohydrate kinase [Streptomyces sp. TLI_105]|uniref:PfkB family carbohydrate kinase n=1 Tax=Streptomyces sp. TLI_105 TaxID=1881019 RepID=UPI000B80DAEA|nr:PfkB family carbohydrate kinase [Streptomyces sp. TLI_105]